MLQFDPKILDLIPHREPMLLINEVLDVGLSSSSSRVFISASTPFFKEGYGVNSWIGIEYMGQTAALIAGYRLKNGSLDPHLGFLLGTRSYKVYCAYFLPGSILKVTCKELSMVGEDFAKFECAIHAADPQLPEGRLLAEANLSVYRKLLT